MIVGAGVIGLAIAQAVGATNRRVIVLEREAVTGRGASTRNSEVVHSGIYYPPGSLKAKLSVAGNRLLRTLGEKGLIPLRQTGKLIVAIEPAEIPMLARLIATGEQNGVEGLRLLEPADISKLEPDVRALAAIHVPSTCVVDVHAYLRYLHARAVEAGVQFAFQTTLKEVGSDPGGYRLIVSQPDGTAESLTATVVINCAGLYADMVARLAGIDTASAAYDQEFAKGHYAQVINGKNARIGRQIYPAPTYEGVSKEAGAGAFSSLGVHATLGLDGRLRLGPDVKYLKDRREDYSIDDADIAGFCESAARFLPFLKVEDVVPESAGIRGKRIVARSGFADFVIADEWPRGRPGWVNLIGIESPGMTSSLAIADSVAEMVKRYLHS